MRVFSEIDKLIADDILKGSPGLQLRNCTSFQNLIDDNEILIITGDAIFIFSKIFEKAMNPKVQDKIITTISLMKYLDDEGYVMYTTTKTKKASFAIVDHKVKLCAQSIDGIYTFDTYIFDASKISLTDKKANKDYEGIKFPDSFNNLAIRYLTSDVYATESFKDLAVHKYVSIEKRSLDSQINIAVCSSVLAIVLALLSFASNIYMTFFNNDHSYTEIKASQYEPVLSIMREDSICINKVMQSISELKTELHQKDSLVNECLKCGTNKK